MFPPSVPIPCRAGVSSRRWTLRCASWGGTGAARSATPEHAVQQAGIGNDQYPTFGGGAGVLIVVRDMDDMVDIEERPPGDVRPPIREEGELQRPPST